jgi:hypothetical protein
MTLAKRMLVLGAVCAVGFSTIFLLPDAPQMRDSRLAHHLPRTFGDWRGENVEVSKRERDVLAADTRFERKSYHNQYDSTALPIEVSIVFSGKDLNNSIHRPETCLKTQGWDFVRLRYLNLPVEGLEAGLPVKEMLCRRVRLDEEGQPVAGKDGKPFEDWQLLYYTFIGHNTITPGHYARTFADIRDRVIGGFDQSWAYATFATPVSGKYADQGAPIGYALPMDEAQTGRYLGDFIGSLIPKMVAPTSRISEEVADRR